MWSKIKNWFLSLGWIKTLGLIVLSVTLAIAAARANKHRKLGAFKEKIAENIAYDGTKKNLEKAEALRQSASVHKRIAEEASATTKAKLQSLGDKNEDIDTIAHRFNSKRVRRRANSITSVGSSPTGSSRSN